MKTIRASSEKVGAFRENIRKKFSMRFHMFLILSATALAGLLASKLLLMIHLNSMLVRYPIAVVVSYLAFLFFVKVWLYYVSDKGSRADRRRSSLLDGGDGVTDLFSGGGSSSGRGVTTGGGGGSFGGGGASGSFETAPGASMENVVESSASLQHSGGSFGGFGDVVSGAADAAGDDDAGKFIIVLVLFVVVLAAIFGAGIYLIAQAPAILSEAAFQFWLAASLRKRTKEMAAPDWAGGVVRMTWKPFAFVLIITLAFGFAVRHYYPEAVKITDVITWRKVTGVK